MASGNFSHSLGRDWCKGLFEHTVGHVLVGLNPPFPNRAADIYGQGDSDDDYRHFGLSGRYPGGANMLMGTAQFAS